MRPADEIERHHETSMDVSVAPTAKDQKEIFFREEPNVISI